MPDFLSPFLSRLLIRAAAFVVGGCVAVASASQPSSADDLPDPDPEAQIAQFVIPEGFEINLFASDPMIRKPVQMNWDEKGRLWLVSSTTYPQIKPGQPTVDQVIVLEDTDHDGKADKSNVFAENLHIPTALAPGDGGVYVANSTEVLFIEDTDGDMREDKRTIVLSGFGTEDTHHLLHTMRRGPEGLLYFLQSIYIHSHVETPYGVRRLLGGGVWEFRPETRQLEVISKGLINPWGFEFDRWGQSFATDGAGSEGVNFIFPGSVFKTSPGAKRVLSGMNPGQPKHAGLEIIEEPHFPDDWQGSFVTCDFRGNRINRFKLTDSGSGYIATQVEDVLASNHRAFRPVDVKVGPDGALYICDWYNPIIQHGEVDFRDERRDHVHGRIWRLTAKGRPLSKPPDFAAASVPDLLSNLQSPQKWTRHFAKRELRHRGPVKVMGPLKEWIKTLDAGTEDGVHALLEAAWTRECINDFSGGLWNQVWTSGNADARAAALRILSHRWREYPKALDVLQQAVTDENARVRLWALAVLADMKSAKAIDVALKVLDLPVDEPIDFLLEQICREQAGIWIPAMKAGDLDFEGRPKHLVFAMKSTGRADALPPLFEALAGGSLESADAQAVLTLAGSVADAGQADEMAEMIGKPDMKAHRAGVFDALVTAAKARKVVATKAETWIGSWLKSDELEIREGAAQLAGLWKIESARPTLGGWVKDPAQSMELRRAATQGLAALGGVPSRDLFNQVFADRDDPETRVLMIEGLSRVGPILAATRAADFLEDAGSAAAATPVFNVFLADKKLPALLAKELEGRTIPEAVAIEGVRMVSTRGVQGPLEATLKKAGQVKQMDRPLSADEMAALVAKVRDKGDAARGENVYRRQQLLCQTCHAIGDAGGLIGPNLVSIGASAPVDYLIESLLEPSKKIKEGYHMVIVTTKDGQVISGGLVQDGDNEVVIRDPANVEHSVPKASIASKVMSPVSMMPPGLTASLREDEFVDLVRFLSELGREGDYKIKPNRFVRTWKTMGPMERDVIDHVRHVGYQALNETNSGYPWQLTFSKVSGELPLNELQEIKMYPWFPKIAQFTLKLDAPGKVTLGFSRVAGVLVAVGDEKINNMAEKVTLDLPAGRHPCSVLVEREAGDAGSIRVELLDGAATLE